MITVEAGSSTTSTKAAGSGPFRSGNRFLIGLLACGMVFLAFAGCTDLERSPTAAATIEGGRCLGAALAHCESHPDGLHVKGLTLVGSSSDGIGLVIERLTTRLVLEGLVIRGYGVALEIGSTCADCTVMIHDARMDASDVGIRVGARGAVHGGISLRNAEVVAGHIAIEGLDIPGALLVEGVVLSSPDESGASGILVRGETGELRASNLTISRFNLAVMGSWTTIRLRNVTINCVYQAIYADNLPTFDADGLTIRDCMATIPCEPPDCGPAAIMLFGELFQTGDMVRMRNLSMTNYKGGILLTDYRSVELEDFTLAKGQWGLGVGPWGTLTMRRGVVSDHTAGGVATTVDGLTVERVNFDHNGFEDSPRSVGGLSINTGHKLAEGEWLATLAVHNSSFTRNTPFGLAAWGDVFDASYNWWGHPLGPSPPTPESIGNPRTLGDIAMGSAVVTEPHLTAPPPPPSRGAQASS